jgi:hypothetical protein
MASFRSRTVIDPITAWLICGPRRRHLHRAHREGATQTASWARVRYEPRPQDSGSAPVIPIDKEIGVGLIVPGMTSHGWDVQLTAYSGRHWRANFFPVGIAHSVVGGSAWEPTPWGRGPAGGVGGVEQTGAMTGDVRSVRKD